MHPIAVWQPCYKEKRHGRNDDHTQSYNREASRSVVKNVLSLHRPSCLTSRAAAALSYSANHRPLNLPAGQAWRGRIWCRVRHGETVCLTALHLPTLLNFQKSLVCRPGFFTVKLDPLFQRFALQLFMMPVSNPANQINGFDWSLLHSQIPLLENKFVRVYTPAPN